MDNGPAAWATSPPSCVFEVTILANVGRARLRPCAKVAGKRRESRGWRGRIVGPIVHYAKRLNDGNICILAHRRSLWRGSSSGRATTDGVFPSGQLLSARHGDRWFLFRARERDSRDSADLERTNNATTGQPRTFSRFVVAIIEDST